MPRVVYIDCLFLASMYRSIKTFTILSFECLPFILSSPRSSVTYFYRKGLSLRTNSSKTLADYRRLCPSQGALRHCDPRPRHPLYAPRCMLPAEYFAPAPNRISNSGTTAWRARYFFASPSGATPTSSPTGSSPRRLGTRPFMTAPAAEGNWRASATPSTSDTKKHSSPGGPA